MVKVGLETGPVTPRARAAPRTNVVLPAPSSPATPTTSPTARSAASRAARAPVSSGEAVTTSTPGRLEEAELNLLEDGRRLGLGVGRRLRPSASEQLRDPSEVLFENLQHPRRVERRGRVEDRV